MDLSLSRPDEGSLSILFARQADLSCQSLGEGCDNLERKPVVAILLIIPMELVIIFKLLSNQSVQVVLIACCVFYPFSANAETVHKGYSEKAPQYQVDGNIISNVDTTAFLWNPRGKSDEDIARRARFLADAAYTRTPEEMEADKGADKLTGLDS